MKITGPAFLTVVLLLGAGHGAFAQVARASAIKENRAFVYQGKIVRPDGSVPTGALPVTLKIFSPDPSLCLLWQETQTVEFLSGGFSVELGHAVNRSAGAVGGAAADFKQSFINNPSLTIPGAACSAGNSYTPQAADDRLLSVTIIDGASTIDVAAMPIKSVPFALQAEEIGGYGLANLMKISGAGSSVTFAPNEVQSLKDLLGGDLNWDMKARKISNLADPTAATDAATRGWVISQINSSGGGTISSIGFAAPSIFSMTGSPLTANGTISMTLAIQNANKVFAGPSSGADATPAFRALDPLDVPALDAAKITSGVFSSARIPAGLPPGGTASGDLSGTFPGPAVAKLQGNAVSSTTLTAGDAGKAYVWNGSSLTAKYLGIADLKNAAGTSYYPQCGPSQTLNWVSATDTLTCASIAIGDGAITYASQTQNKVFASPSGASGAPTYRALVAADIPGLDWSKITSGQPTTLSGFGITDNVVYNGGQAGAVTLGSTDANAVTVKANNTAAITISSSGNVGVGTTGPAAQLDVRRDTATSSVDSTTSLLDLSNRNSTANNFVPIRFNTVDGTPTYRNGAYVAGNTTARTGSGVTMDLVFGTTNNFTSANERMRITGAGNVGIGTTSPSDKLEVAGAIRSSANSGVIQIYNTSSSVSNINANTGARLDLGSGSAAMLSIASSGNVGIGTSLPNNLLQIHDAAGTNAVLQLTHTTSGTGSTAGLRLMQNATASYVFNGSNGNTYVSTGNGTVVKFASGAASSVNYLRITPAVTGAAPALTADGSDTDVDLSFAPKGAGKTVFSSGSVGIGTTSPAAKLDVQGEIKIGNTSSSCNSANEGQQRYNGTSKDMEFCNGTAWTSMTAPSFSMITTTPVSSATQDVWNYSSYVSCPTGYTLRFYGVFHHNVGIASANYHYCNCQASGNSIRGAVLGMVNANFSCSCSGLCTK